MKHLNIQLEDSQHLAIKQHALTIGLKLKEYVVAALMEKCCNTTKNAESVPTAPKMRFNTLPEDYQ